MTDTFVRRLIRANGCIEVLPGPLSIKEIEGVVAAGGCLDTVNLRNGMVMIVDDLGHDKGLPRNDIATQLYHGVCIPGTTHYIAGDVVVVPDADFGGR